MTIHRKLSSPARAQALVVVGVAVSCLPVHAQLWTKRADLQKQAEQMRALAQSMQASVPQGDVRAFATPATAYARELAPKKPGVTRLGVILAEDRMEGKGDLNDGEPVRAAEVQLLSGPGMEAVPLKAILPAQALQEAKQLDCDYVLSSSVSQQSVAGGSRFGKLGSMRTLQLAATAAQFVPGVGAAAMLANMAVSTAASQAAARTLANFNKGVKANSDVTLEYKLTDVAGTTVLSATEKARSKGDGDNVLTPMLTASATKFSEAVELKH